LALKIPYCKLYDKGYTSLGGTTDTNRNPVLRRESVSKDGKPKVEFRPAYELIEDEAERLGREKDWKATAGSGKMLKVEGQDEHVAVFDEDDTDAPST
jgi:3'-phosphoadenosine 5'-phosphosulfate sulfotransferase (PAPS reductase)/FAD synthetase